MNVTPKPAPDLPECLHALTTALAEATRLAFAAEIAARTGETREPTLKELLDRVVLAVRELEDE